MSMYYALEIRKSGRVVKFWDFYLSLATLRKDVKDCLKDGYEVKIYRESGSACPRWLEIK